MPLYDSATRAALASGRLVLRDFLYIHGFEGEDPMPFGFWTGEDDISPSVVSAITGAPETRDYDGGGTLIEVDTITSTIGLEARSIQVKLSQIHLSVQDMVRGYVPGIRHAVAEVHRGLYSPTDGGIVSTPFPRFLGRVDGAPIETPAAGDEGAITLKLVSNSVELTVTNPMLKSDATQQLRSGDRFRRFADIADPRSVWWGETGGGS